MSRVDEQAVWIEAAIGSRLVEQARELFVEYAARLPFDLAFQQFDRELAGLPGDYGLPGGRLLLARWGGRAVGCVAFRPLAPRTAELKRLYVQPAARGLGVGRRLTIAAVDIARRCGYRRIRLDTEGSMQEALALYPTLGFHEIAPYSTNVLAGARFFELLL
jgi:ribosomal protein S18 acetylase RimI-like enzyme